MRLYALRDRLLDYYLQPFVAPNDNAVRASLSQTILAGGDQSAIAQAPHHFELHCIAEIDDDTTKLTPVHQLICDCSSLIRPKQVARPPESHGERRMGGTPNGGSGEASLTF